MKNYFLVLLILFCFSAYSQKPIKSKNLSLKYTLPDGWKAEEFGGPFPWETGDGKFCKCGGVSFTKAHKDGTMHVLVYPSTRSGLDSAKRESIGDLHFEMVQKYDKTTNKNFSFEKRKSYFVDRKSNSKSYEVIRYQAKQNNNFFIFYAWQENMGLLNSTNEKELTLMVNAIEPL